MLNVRKLFWLVFLCKIAIASSMDEVVQLGRGCKLLNKRGLEIKRLLSQQSVDDKLALEQELKNISQEQRKIMKKIRQKLKLIEDIL